MTDTQQDPPPQVWPVLSARDARALIKFLVDAFGFTETVVYGDGDRVHHAELAWPHGGGIMLGSKAHTPPGAFGAYVVTGDPDALFARAVANGAKVERELNDDHGRAFTVLDPEGNSWTFGDFPGHPR